MKLSSPFTEEQVSELFSTLDLNESVEAERNFWREDPSPTTQCNYASTLVCTFGPFEQEMGIDLLLDVLSDKSSPKDVVKKTLNHLCLGYFRQSNFQSASQYSLQCLEKYPRDQMAQHIYNIIQMKLLDSRLTSNAPSMQAELRAQSPQAEKEEEVQTMLKKLVRKASMTTLRLEEIFSNVESNDSIYDGLVDTNDQDDLFADIDALITTVPSTGKRKDTQDGKQAPRTQPRLATKSITVTNASPNPTPNPLAPTQQPSPTLTSSQGAPPSLPPMLPTMPALPPNLPPPNLPPDRPGNPTVAPTTHSSNNGESAGVREEWNPFGLASSSLNASESASPRQQQNQMTSKQRAMLVADRVKSEAAAIIDKEREQAELNSTSPRSVGPNAQQPTTTTTTTSAPSRQSSVSQLMQNFQHQNAQPAPSLPQRHASTPFQRENSHPTQQQHFNTNPHPVRGERELHHQPHSMNLLSGLNSGIGGFQIQFQAGPRPEEFNHATTLAQPFVSEQQLLRERQESEERERREKARAEERAKEQAFVNAERKKQMDERELLERERLEWEAIREERRIRQEKEREEAERQERARAEAERIAAEQEALEEKDDCAFCKKTFKATMLAEFSGRLLCASCMKLIMQRMKQKEQIAASKPPPEPKRNIYSIRSANGKVGTVTSAEKLLAALATYTAVRKQTGAENDFLLKEIASTFNI